MGFWRAFGRAYHLVLVSKLVILDLAGRQRKRKILGKYKSIKKIIIVIRMMRIIIVIIKIIIISKELTR